MSETAKEAMRHMRCPECGRVASVAEWCSRPICVHAWVSNVPEVWDGDNVEGEGGPIEQSPSEAYRSPGPRTWMAMVVVVVEDAP